MRKNSIIIIILIFFCLVITIFSANFKSRYNRTIDGDTISVDIYGINEFFGKDIKIRLAGIDTPEIRGNEREFGLKAKKFVEDKLDGQKEVNLINCSRGKYFRLVCEVCISGKNLNKMLIESGNAKFYNDKEYIFSDCVVNNGIRQVS